MERAVRPPAGGLRSQRQHDSKQPHRSGGGAPASFDVAKRARRESGEAAEEVRLKWTKHRKSPAGGIIIKLRAPVPPICTLGNQSIALPFRQSRKTSELAGSCFGTWSRRETPTRPSAQFQPGFPPRPLGLPVALILVSFSHLDAGDGAGGSSISHPDS